MAVAPTVEGLAPVKAAAINRWLPYWAVFQADMQQTMRSWVYRIWVLVSFVSAGGYLLYRFGLSHEAGIVQPASRLIADMLRWTLLGSVSLIVVLCAGSISSERGSMADSVLSRGISRHQYFLGKWHSRLTTVLLTFWILGGTLLVGSVFLLHEDVSYTGSLLAMLAVSALLGAVITCGVTVSAVCNSTLLGVALLWVILYGGGFALSMLPSIYPSPARLLSSLPHILRGYYDARPWLQLVGWCAGVSSLVALMGMAHFSRRDI
jgi:ABC-2 type transport system permease protein